jgi:hypothetical protein
MLLVLGMVAGGACSGLAWMLVVVIIGVNALDSVMIESETTIGI